MPDDKNKDNQSQGSNTQPPPQQTPKPDVNPPTFTRIEKDFGGKDTLKK